MEKPVIEPFMMSDTNISRSQLLEENHELRIELATAYQSADIRTTNHYASKEQNRQIKRVTNDGLWDWNLQTNDTVYSPRWKSMLGYDECELDNRFDTFINLVNPDEKDHVLKTAQDYVTGLIDSFEIEIRMRHKDGHEVIVLSRAFLVYRESDGKPVRLVGTHTDITEHKRIESYSEKNARVLEMIAIGRPAPAVYDVIALMYENRHPGMRCSILELQDNKLLHGGAPSLPKEYCDAIHGLENGPDVGSCGSSTFTGKRVLVENIETDSKWASIKHVALPHGLRSCWSEPIKSSTGKVLGAFGMYYNHPALPDDEESADLESAARLVSIVMERDQNQRRIRQLAYTDELTGLASRAHFYLHLEELIKSSERHNRRFSLLYIDLDNFKDVNDSLGHDIGDLLLKEIGDRLINTGREIDFITRMSGDEFSILVEDVVDDYSAANVAQRCLDAISQTVELSNSKLSPACSIGIAHYPDDGEDLPTLLKAADTSLYAAKESGKHCYAFYTPELTQKAEYRFQVEQYLREAIEKQQLTLVYQPQVDIQTGKIIGVEALSRWHHHQLGHIPPNVFIETAERIGMIKPLTEWVLNSACRQAAEWKKSGLPSLNMAVNISPKHFLDKDLTSLIESVITKTGMIPSELELEVTEGVVQTDQKNLSVFQDLKDLGVLLAIDDFGTGYSSFASLKHLKVDYLKIDKYFIDDIVNDTKTRLLIGSMIEMGHNLGYGIIAEGIETPKQFEILREFRCETAQGYLFSKPVNNDKITQLRKNDFGVS